MARTPGGTLSAFTLLSTPDAPTITGVTTSIGSASVAFTAPSDTGDGAISSYVVTAVDESSGVSTGVSGASSPITISPGGGTFKIRMQALNPYGPGRLTEFVTGVSPLSGLQLYGWGDNSPLGQIGDNTTVDKSSPVQVGAPTTWSLVSAGENHTAAIKTDNSLYAWGGNSTGAVGDGSVVSRSSPVQVGALTNWAQVSCGGDSTASVKTDGTLWSWGRNAIGQLGHGNDVYRSSPTQVGALTNWAQVSFGYNFCHAVKTDNSIWSWGRNTSTGVLGHNNTTNRSSPVQIGALTDWAQVSSGGSSSALAVKTNGTLWAWGSNSDGGLGDGTAIDKSSPVQIGALTNWSQSSMGVATAAALKTDGTLWAWGYAAQGNIGDGTTIARSSPVQIGASTDWSLVESSQNSPSSGQNFTTALKTNGTLWSWGFNGGGQLGDNTTVNRSSPIQIGSDTAWTFTTTGGKHTLATLGVV
jgi:alpha-tubulin suppressor-like RCC1 family protein